MSYFVESGFSPLGNNKNVEEVVKITRNATLDVKNNSAVVV